MIQFEPQSEHRDAFVLAAVEAGCYVHEINDEEGDWHSLFTVAAGHLCEDRSDDNDLTESDDVQAQVLLSKICASPNYDPTHYENALLVLLALDAGDLDEAARIMRNIHFTKYTDDLRFFKRFWNAVKEHEGQDSGFDESLKGNNSWVLWSRKWYGCRGRTSGVRKSCVRESSCTRKGTRNGNGKRKSSSSYTRNRTRNGNGKRWRKYSK
jgi:hypothetical protein